MGVDSDPPYDTLPVEFRAADAGEAPLTWGQAHIWRAVARYPQLDVDLNIKRRVVPDAGVPVDAAAAALRRLIERHQALRTHVRRDGTLPSQVVEPAGTIAVDVVAVSEPELAPALDAAVDRLASRAFDLDRDWPVRPVLVCVGGLVRAVGLVGSHIVLDGYAMTLLAEELRALLTGADSDEVQWQPLDQAREESSERGRRLERKTLRFWQRNLAAAPPSAFADPPDPPDLAAPTGSMVMRRWRMESPAVAAVVPVLAQQIGVSTSTLLLTASALVIRALTRVDPVVLKVVAGNRTTPRQRSLVAAVVQDGIFVLRPPAEDFAGTARQVYRDATEAYYYASADPFALAEVVAQADRDRGLPTDLTLLFNDARLGREWPDTLLPEVSRAAVEQLRARGRIVAAERLPDNEMKLFLAVTYAADHAGLSLLVDLRYVPEQTGLRALRGVEALLCESLLRPLPVAEIPDLIAAQSSEELSK